MLGTADKEGEPGGWGRVLTGPLGAAETGLGVRNAWVLQPGILNRPCCISALAQLSDDCVEISASHQRDMEIQIEVWKLVSSLGTLGLEPVGTGLKEKGCRGWESGDPFSSEGLREADPHRGYGAGLCPEEAGTQLKA